MIYSLFIIILLAILPQDRGLNVLNHKSQDGLLQLPNVDNLLGKLASHSRKHVIILIYLMNALSYDWLIKY